MVFFWFIARIHTINTPKRQLYFSQSAHSLTNGLHFCAVSGPKPEDLALLDRKILSKTPSDGLHSANLRTLLSPNDRGEVTGVRFCRVWGIELDRKIWDYLWNNYIQKKPSDGVYSANLHALSFSNSRDEVTGPRFCRVWGIKIARAMEYRCPARPPTMDYIQPT